MELCFPFFFSFMFKILKILNFNFEITNGKRIFMTSQGAASTSRDLFKLNTLSSAPVHPYSLSRQTYLHLSIFRTDSLQLLILHPELAAMDVCQSRNGLGSFLFN